VNSKEYTFVEYFSGEGSRFPWSGPGTRRAWHGPVESEAKNLDPALEDAAELAHEAAYHDDLTDEDLQAVADVGKRRRSATSPTSSLNRKQIEGAGMITEQVPVIVYGGPTTLVEYGGLRLLADPTFDPPGEYPTPMGGYKMHKTEPSAISPDDLGRIDAVLLSHDEHDDNLDNTGRAFLPTVPVVLTTESGAVRLGGNAKGLAFWETTELTRPDGGAVTVTGLPARHGPHGAEALAGDVVGFLLTAPDLPSVYVSGDNAALELVEEIAARFAPVDTAILFLGGARHAVAFDNALITLDSAQGAEAAKLLGSRRVVPAHFDSWAHFKEGRQEIEKAFADAGIADRLQFSRYSPAA
jgi:L-ascorbate metabolism protein UlaG (beta-lactamase superfamily)